MSDRYKNQSVAAMAAVIIQSMGKDDPNLLAEAEHNAWWLFHHLGDSDHPEAPGSHSEAEDTLLTLGAYLRCFQMKRPEE